VLLFQLVHRFQVFLDVVGVSLLQVLNQGFKVVVFGDQSFLVAFVLLSLLARKLRSFVGVVLELLPVHF